MSSTATTPAARPGDRGRPDSSSVRPLLGRGLLSGIVHEPDAESRAWLSQLRAQGVARDAAIARLHRLLVAEARYEVRRRTAALSHPSGRDLDDLAVMAADDALMVILAKLDEFRGDARFTTWARRFADLEVPGKIRRRLGHTRETPSDDDLASTTRAQGAGPEQHVEARELARTVGGLIAHELTTRQREVLVALAVQEVDTDVLAERLGSTPGALYKTLHDARRKLRNELERLDSPRPGVAPRPAVPAAPPSRPLPLP